MTNRRKDPRVKEWMREHKEEVERVQKRYDELKNVSLQGLIEAAPADIVAKIRSLCISGIIAAESKEKK